MALDGSMVVAANNAGTAYVWRMLRGASVTTHFEPLHKLRAHQGEWFGKQALQLLSWTLRKVIRIAAPECSQRVLRGPEGVAGCSHRA